jgi:hypothetical protein
MLSPQDIQAVPSFARSTGLSCSNCHISFPMLNAFGRNFKANGYTMVGADVLESQTGEENNSSTLLKMLKSFPLSAMFMGSITHLNKPEPGTTNDNYSFPQQLSLFFGGEITPNIGIFLQATYDDQSGTFGIDNTDIRFSDITTIGSTDLTYGITLNNNPTVQDLWHTTSAWGMPFAASSQSPTPSSSTLIDGGLAESALGVGAYALWNSMIYGEFSFYKSAFQGGAHPPDESVTNLIKGVAPYWRLALQKQIDKSYISIGTFGLSANILPAGITGDADQYTDFGVDAQYELNIGSGTLSAYATYVHENKDLKGTFAAGNSQNSSDNLNTFKLFANLFFLNQMNLTLGYFNLTGSSDNILYQSAALTGSNAGKPDSDGIIGEISYLPWYNTRFSLQYTFYNKFNGASSNYDGFGRDASHNNTLYLLTWIAF